MMKETSERDDSNLSLSVIFLTAVTLGLCVYAYLKTKYNHWRKRAIRGPELPFPLGTLSLGNKSLAQQLVQWAAKYGKVFGIYTGFTPILVISDAEMVKEALIKNFDKFSDRPIISGHFYTSQAVINQMGDAWKHDRAVITPVFSSGKMKQMYPLMKECYQSLEKEMNRLVSQGDEIDVKILFSKLTLMVIARCAFATQVDAFSQPDHTLLKKLLSIFKFSRSRIFMSLFLPARVQKWINFSLIDPSAIDYLASVCRKILDHRKQLQGHGNNYTDLLQLLMQSNDDGFNDIKIIGNCILFFNAGYETTSTLLTWISYALAKNPEIQEKLYEEVVRARDETDGQLDYEILFNLKYLDAVINETLRMYPPITMFDRVCTRDHTFYDGTQVLSGDLVRVATYSLHHSDEYFPNPQTFDPTRFLPENKDSIVPGSFVPFVIGPRNCIGMRFALMEVKMTLAELIKVFKFVPSKGTPESPVLVGNSFLLSMDNYRVAIERRT